MAVEQGEPWSNLTQPKIMSVGHWVMEQDLERVVERVGERVVERVGERVVERVGEWVGERVIERDLNLT